MKVVIVGGVAAGASCAARLRRMDENCEIIMLEKSKHVSYANCGLPYYVGNVIKEEENLTVQTPESFKERFNVEARTNSLVKSINREEKYVVVENLLTKEEYKETYDKLVLATGAKPIIPNLPGIDSSLIFTLRNVTDASRIHQFVSQNKPKNAIVIGGGFIGLEVCENLRHLGLNVTLIEASNQIMAPVDLEMSKILNREMIQNGVNLRLNELVTGFETKEKITAFTKEGSYAADFVVLAIGVLPDTKLAMDCGLEVGFKNSLVVNEYLQTSDENIYAGGDMVSIYNKVSCANELISLAGPANKEGRTIANNIAGKMTKYDGANQTSILKLFRLTCATTGINEKRAQALGLNYEVVLATPSNHATYYPDFTNMFIKVLFDKETGKIYGGQIIGYEGVDKRIDVLATTIYNEGTYQDLVDLDLAYAPSYSSAKDPLNMIGYIIENIMNGYVKQWRYGQTIDGLLIDVSKKPDFESGHLPNAINIPLEELRDNLDKLPKNEKIYLNCRTGLRSYVGCRILTQHGFECYNMMGGYNFYKATLETVRESKKEEVLKQKFVSNDVGLDPKEVTRVKGLGFLWCKGTQDFNGRIITRNGMITNEELETITKAAKLYGNGSVALTTRLTLEVQHIPFQNIDPFIEFLNQSNVITGGTGSKVRPVVSCKGTTCQYGAIDTNGLSLKIHELFYLGYHDLSLPHKFKIAVGGCPNNCVKPNLNDIGIVGQRIPTINLDKCRGCKNCQVINNCPIKSSHLENGKITVGDACNNCGRCVGKCPFHAVDEYTVGYKIYIGGRWGKSIHIGQALTQILYSEEEVIQMIDKAILLFRSEGLSGERFSDTIDRLGFDYVNEKLLSDDLLQRKNEILGLKVIGGATC